MRFFNVLEQDRSSSIKLQASQEEAANPAARTVGRLVGLVSIPSNIPPVFTPGPRCRKSKARTHTMPPRRPCHYKDSFLALFDQKLSSVSFHGSPLKFDSRSGVVHNLVLESSASAALGTTIRSLLRTTSPSSRLPVLTQQSWQSIRKPEKRH